MNNRKNRICLAIGLLLIVGSTLVSRLVMPMSDSVNGFYKGLGIGLMIVSIYRMKYRSTC
jgi:hypothetical protein